MKVKSIIKIENYFETIIILILIIFFLYLIKNFLLPIFLASIFVFFTKGLYEKLVNKIKNKQLSSFLVIVVILTLILLPLYFLLLSLINQTYSALNHSVNLIDNINLNSCHFLFCEQIKSNLGFIDLSIDKIFTSVVIFIKNSYSIIFNSISSMVLDLFIFLLAFYYLLIDGDKFVKYIKRLIPMKLEYKNALFIKFRDISEAIFLNTILIALIQGLLLGVGFYIFNIPSPILWGLVASFFALIPIIGTGFIWVPGVIYLFLIGNFISGSLFLFYGLFIISLSDNLLAPYLLKKKIQVHPFLILITILGGLQIWGFFGIFIGPILISFLIAIIQLYNLDFN